MIRRLPTADLGVHERGAIRNVLRAAFGGDEHFTDEHWQHALGGVHFVLDVDGEIRGHAAVIERDLQVGGVPLQSAYVEAVATAPDTHGLGYGTRVMRAVGSYIQERFELGALATGLPGFYARLGWRTWRGPLSVRTPAGEQPTSDQDGHILVLTTPATVDIDLGLPISCEWRQGDVW